ncbi:hypothetical protein STEG23_034487, partial [Scotinomys teguina]
PSIKKVTLEPSFHGMEAEKLRSKGKVPTVISPSCVFLVVVVLLNFVYNGENTHSTNGESFEHFGRVCHPHPWLKRKSLGKGGPLTLPLTS